MYVSSERQPILDVVENPSTLQEQYTQLNEELQQLKKAEVSDPIQVESFYRKIQIYLNQTTIATAGKTDEVSRNLFESANHLKREARALNKTVQRKASCRPYLIACLCFSFAAAFFLPFILAGKDL